MSPEKNRNTGHSAFQRLLRYARTRGEDFNLLLFRYGVERILYRLSTSSYSDKFILKGASLFLVWKGQNYRVTKDADLLGSSPADIEIIASIFRDLCKADTEESDGIKFMPDTVRAVPIREEQAYGGIRVTFMGILHQARIPVQIDIGSAMWLRLNRNGSSFRPYLTIRHRNFWPIPGTRWWLKSLRRWCAWVWPTAG